MNQNSQLQFHVIQVRHVGLKFINTPEPLFYQRTWFTRHTLLSQWICFETCVTFKSLKIGQHYQMA